MHTLPPGKHILTNQVLSIFAESSKDNLQFLADSLGIDAALLVPSEVDVPKEVTDMLWPPTLELMRSAPKAGISINEVVSTPAMLN